MGVKFNPGLKEAGIDPSMIEKLIEVQRLPLETTKKRREQTVEKKVEIEKLIGILSELDASLSNLKTRYDFYKLKLDSSHPDIVDGTVSSGALLGAYELEVRATARSEKELAYGFPDKDQTPVGFGFMMVERDDGEQMELTVEPHTTLEGLASQINDSEAGVKAMVINTKYQPDAYRLLVVSTQSGKEAKIFIDEDTTFLEFKEQVTGRNLDVLFEDVPVTDEDNILDELINDVTLNVRRSEPGTRVQVSIIHDVEKTMESIKDFVDKYNTVAAFINDQFQENAETGQYGILSGDSTIKTVMRQLQSGLISIPGLSNGKFGTLAEVGISTEPKTGLLSMDTNKVTAALTEDYEGVADLFIRSQNSIGLAEVLAQKIKSFRDPGFGVVKSRLRGLKKVIENQDREIERKERQLQSSETSIKRKFTALEGTLAQLKGQSDFLKARFSAKK